MSSAVHALMDLQTRMHAHGFREGWPELTERLFFTQERGFWFIEYFGNGYTFFPEFLQLLTSPDIVEQLRWLSLRGLDEGANGTRNWDFTELLKREVQFPKLQSLQIARTPSEAHNQSIVAETYEEEGQLGRLLDKMPALIELSTPSAPDGSFCNRPPHPLRLLYMDCGLDHQNFIENLAKSDSFPGLQLFEFSDYCQFYMEDWEEQCVPFAQYEKLFQSENLPSLRTFFLKNSRLTEVQTIKLKELRPALQFTQEQSRIF